ncbi:MAG: GTP-binding protein [Flavobacteriaceae bacterium]|nr:GTP-binding protein [Bacteroidia bacterium]MBT8288859.1 GTP-binding protein [Bacteroidia bacterium]NNF74382.1 GTP-binding protein [Flavobacteriaceae bacterium]NNK71593.1 GTP-binding protein [Flavobacteriaceae bacterium]
MPSKKIVLVGHFGVGKTSLMRRFIDNAFSEDYKVTLGVQIKKKNVQLSDGQPLSMIIWDLEGNTTVRKTRESYLLGTNGFIYVFDATRSETYLELKDEIGFLKEKYPGASVKVIGNKLDLVNKESLKDSLKSQNIEYDFLTSAKKGINVEKMFDNLGHELML